MRIVQLTPPGRGAIATVLVEGPDARQRVDSQFRSPRGDPLGSYPAERLVYGRFGPPPGEEVVIHGRCGQSVEIHCHGGDAAVTRIVSLLEQTGSGPVSWPAWAPSHHDDPIVAAAHLALADARTERTAAILLDQYQGALRRSWAEVQTAPGMGRCRPGPNVARSAPGAGPRRPASGRALARGAGGRAQRRQEQPDQCLAGLSTDDCAFCAGHDARRRNRDHRGGRLALGILRHGRSAAGRHPLEQAGIDRAQEQLAAADLVLLVFDISRPWSESDESLRRRFPTALVVHNKSDLAAAEPRPAGIAVCASSGAARPTAAGRRWSSGSFRSPPPPGPRSRLPRRSSANWRLPGRHWR